MRSFVLFAILGLAALGIVAATPSQSQASWLSEWLNRMLDRDPYQRQGYAQYPYGGYYGRGGHDEVPHWHRSVTPYGQQYWYGRGPHDDVPHQHRVTPYSYKGRVYTPYGYVESYYPRTPYQAYPYYYAPW